MIVHFKGGTVSLPVFRLCSFALPYTDNYVYLEHVINSRLTDDADVMRHTRSLYATANGVVCKFSSSSLCTKLLLFEAFCTPIYGCSLWCNRAIEGNRPTSLPTEGSKEVGLLPSIALLHSYMIIVGKYRTRPPAGEEVQH